METQVVLGDIYPGSKRLGVFFLTCEIYGFLLEYINTSKGNKTMTNQSSGLPGREMYYNISNISNISEYQSKHFTEDEMMTDEVRDSEASPPLLTSLREASVSQEKSGSVITEPDPIAWICAQWAFNQTRRKNDTTPATRIRITATLHYQSDMGTQVRPKKITFSMTDRLREFQPANPFQKHIKTMEMLRNIRWIGKARIRQPKTYEGPLPDHYRKNIPDLVMTAWIENDLLHARLHTTEQTIDLVFDQELSLAQQKLYDGEARWGKKIRRRPRDDFYDWKNYA